MLELMENSGLAVWVRESPSIFAYTFILSLHAIGLAIVIGVSTIIALRMLGKFSSIPLAELHQLYGALWVGFAINIISGLMLFMAGATNMAAMPAFWIKITAIISGLVIAVLIRSRHLLGAEAAAGVVSAQGKRLARISLACWFVALVAGRLTGYPTFLASLFQ